MRKSVKPKNNIEIMAPRYQFPKPSEPKPKTESLSVADGLVMYLYDAGDSNRNFVRMDFNDYSCYGRANNFNMILGRAKLKEVANFINKYLENN